MRPSKLGIGQIHPSQKPIILPELSLNVRFWDRMDVLYRATDSQSAWQPYYSARDRSCKFHF